MRFLSRSASLIGAEQTVCVQAVACSKLQEWAVVDTTGAPARPDQTVAVEGDRISQVGDAKKVHAPKGAQVVNAHGLFVIPGLWDMHVHVWETDRTFPLFIANGVLGVRNMGGHLDDLKRWRSQVINGELLGPRLVISGPLVDGLNPAHPDSSVVIHDPAEGRAIVDSLKQSGVDFIMVFDNLTPEEYYAIAEESKNVGLPFAGHLPRGRVGERRLDRGPAQYRAPARQPGRILQEFRSNRASERFAAGEPCRKNRARSGFAETGSGRLRSRAAQDSGSTSCFMKNGTVAGSRHSLQEKSCRFSTMTPLRKSAPCVHRREGSGKSGTSCAIA